MEEWTPALGLRRGALHLLLWTPIALALVGGATLGLSVLFRRVFENTSLFTNDAVLAILGAAYGELAWFLLWHRTFEAAGCFHKGMAWAAAGAMALVSVGSILASHLIVPLEGTEVVLLAVSFFLCAMGTALWDSAADLFPDRESA